MTRAKKYVCDCCEGDLGKRFRQGYVYETIKSDLVKYGDDGFCEKELKICNDCIQNLNFRKKK